MHRWVFATWMHWALLLAMTPVAWAQTAPQTAPATVAPKNARLEELIRRGADLESRRQWAEVLVHYEEALKAYPGDQALETRLETARCHYGLARRYSDTSYVSSLQTLSEADSLGLYDEVLNKVQSLYVHEPNWQQLVDRGTRDMELALTNEYFVNEHLRDVAPEWIETFRRELRRRVGLAVIRSRQDAEDAVKVAGQLGRRHLGVAPAAVLLEYTYAAVTSLDDYSTYLTANQLNELYSQIDGNFVGLGIELQADKGALLIVKVIEGSPAQAGGLVPQDRIIAVDNRPTQGLSTDQAAAMLQGLEGSFVDVTVESAKRPRTVLKLKRQQIEVPSVDNVRMIDTEIGLGYFRLTSFQKTTPREVDAALWNLHRQGMQSLVVDVRGNPGGLLNTSVEVADRFIEAGRIVSTRGRNAEQNWTYSAHKAGTWRMPLIVLIDGDSASAAEIFAGAIRDHRRGYLIGQNSYGKGSVQSIYQLSRAGAGLRLTTAKFYSPNGQAFAKVGVAPHIVVQKVMKPAITEAGGIVASEPVSDVDPVVSEAVRVARRDFLPQPAANRVGATQTGTTQQQ